MKNFAKGAIWFGIYYGVQTVVSVLAAVVAIFVNQIPRPDTTDPVEIIAAFTEILMSVAVPTLIVSSVICIAVYFGYKFAIKEPLDIKAIQWQKVIFFIGLGCVLNVTINMSLGLVESLMPESWITMHTESTGAVTTGQHWVWLLLCTGILVPIMEEITFRYGMHGHMKKSNVVLAYIISSIAFGLIHGNPIQIGYATILGFFLAYVYTKSNNICYPMILHMCMNTMSLAAMLFDSALIYCLVIGGTGLLLVISSILLLPQVKTIFKRPAIDATMKIASTGLFKI